MNSEVSKPVFISSNRNFNKTYLAINDTNKYLFMVERAHEIGMSLLVNNQFVQMWNAWHNVKCVCFHTTFYESFN